MIRHRRYVGNDVVGFASPSIGSTEQTLHLIYGFADASGKGKGSSLHDLRDFRGPKILNWSVGSRGIKGVYTRAQSHLTLFGRRKRRLKLGIRLPEESVYTENMGFQASKLTPKVSGARS